MSSNLVLKRFANCIPVKGYMRAAIYDLQRNSIDLIPLSLYELISGCELQTRKQILERYTEQEQETIQEYLDFLEEKEYIFFTTPEGAQHFPELKQEWDYPAQISNAIIENQELVTTALLEELSDLGVNSLVIFIDNKQIEAKAMSLLLEQFNGASVENISFIFTGINDEQYLTAELELLLQEDGRVIEVKVYQSPENKKEGKFEFIHGKFRVEEDVRKHMAPNIHLYMEALFYNTYYNRKLFIGKKGEIKNSFNTSGTSGKLGETKLIEVVQQPEFQELWNLSKDQTDVCKDCEFRYLCMDRRLPIKRGTNQFYFEKECDYNPYLGKWKQDTGYLNLEQCGIKSTADGFSINPEHIEQLLATAWSTEEESNT